MSATEETLATAASRDISNIMESRVSRKVSIRRDPGNNKGPKQPYGHQPKYRREYQQELQQYKLKGTKIPIGTQGKQESASNSRDVVNRWDANNNKDASNSVSITFLCTPLSHKQQWIIANVHMYIKYYIY